MWFYFICLGKCEVGQVQLVKLPVALPQSDSMSYSSRNLCFVPHFSMFLYVEWFVSFGEGSILGKVGIFV